MLRKRKSYRTDTSRTLGVSLPVLGEQRLGKHRDCELGREKMLARQIAVGLGIAAILPWLIYYGVSTFYPPPRQDYSTYQPLPNTATAEERKAHAAEQAKKRQQFASDARTFARVLFAISSVLGVLAVLLGAYLKPHAVGAGLIGGGTFALAIGYWGYAQYLDDGFRFASLLAGLLVLLFVGLRKLNPA
jgi:hypothetical protein